MARFAWTNRSIGHLRPLMKNDGVSDPGQVAPSPAAPGDGRKPTADPSGVGVETTEEKARVVAEETVVGAQVAEMARRHGVGRSLICTWRREVKRWLPNDGVGVALPELVPVVATDVSREKSAPVAGGESRASRPIGAPSNEGALEIVLPGDVRVTVLGRGYWQLDA